MAAVFEVGYSCLNCRSTFTKKSRTIADLIRSQAGYLGELVDVDAIVKDKEFGVKIINNEIHCHFLSLPELRPEYNVFLPLGFAPQTTHKCSEGNTLRGMASLAWVGVKNKGE
jgi:hypothetical protein